MSDWPRSMEIRPIDAWPGEQTATRHSSAFSAGLTATLQLLDRELDALHAEGTPVLEVAIPPADFRIDGRPRAHARATHPGVILSVVTDVGPLRYPCDRFATWQENLRAIALSLEALRKVDRYGVTKTGEQYRGFLAIEAAPHTAPADVFAARRFLLSVVWPGNIDAIAVDDATLIARAKRAAHPDTGGDVDTWLRVVEAERVLREAAA